MWIHRKETQTLDGQFTIRECLINLLVSGICESRAGGSVMPWLLQGVPSFRPLVWAVGLPAFTISDPKTGAIMSLGGVPFPSILSWTPSAYKHIRARQSAVGTI